MTDADAEYALLTSRDGRDLIDEVAGVEAPRPADLMRWRGSHRADLVAAALRMVDARRRARRKFSRADEFWLTAIGVEQATAEPVARHKAGRFAAAPLVADLCSGVGGDALALAAAGARVVAVDADAGHPRRLAWNARALDLADRIHPVRATAERAPVPPKSIVHIDPDRRARRSGSRARTIQAYSPPLPWLRELMSEAAGGAIKLSPASDFAAHFNDRGLEVELTSLDGECKEATVWFGSLAGDCRRRATVLPSAATFTDRDVPDAPIAAVHPLDTWIFDPDPALLRAGLLDAFAALHRLGRVAEGIDYLSGPTLVETPFLVAFRVIERFPLDLKRLRREVAARGLGPLEIKARGLDLRPEQVRKQLDPRGPNSATWILCGGAGPATAILAQRHCRGGP